MNVDDIAIETQYLLVEAMEQRLAEKVLANGVAYSHYLQVGVPFVRKIPSH